MSQSVFTYFNKSVPKMKFEAKFLKKFKEI